MTKKKSPRRRDFVFRLFAEDSSVIPVLAKFNVPYVPGKWYRVWTLPVDGAYRLSVECAISARQLSSSEVSRMRLY